MSTASSSNPLPNFAANQVKVSSNSWAEAASSHPIIETAFNKQLQDRQSAQRLRQASQPSKLAMPKPVPPSSVEPYKPVVKDTPPAIEVSTRPQQASTQIDKPDTGGERAADESDEDLVQTDPATNAAFLIQAQLVTPAPSPSDTSPKTFDDLVQDKGVLGTALKVRNDAAARTGNLAAEDAAKFASDRQPLLDLSLASQTNQAAALSPQDQARLLETESIAATDGGSARQQFALPAGRIDVARNQSMDQTKSAFAIHVPVGADGWDKALGHKVVMMVSNQQQEVEMQLNPPHLGPMDVKITLNQDQASISFVVAHAPIREALQASMPRLSEMMAESGIQLTQANVQTRDGRDGNSREDQRHGRGERSGPPSGDEIAVPGTSIRARLLTALPGKVNLFV